MTPVSLIKPTRRPINPKYGDGPWRDEPDRLEWRDSATGLPCLIKRGPLGQWCGYVAVAPGHPLHGVDTGAMPSEVDLATHGGAVTYAGPCQEGAEGVGICHVPRPGEPADVWWIGYDCMHAWDLVPAMHRHMRRYLPDRLPWGSAEIYRTADYNIGVCTRLAGVLGSIVAPLPALPAGTQGAAPTATCRDGGGTSAAAALGAAPVPSSTTAAHSAEVEGGGASVGAAGAAPGELSAS
jgi:hypothetical protein